MCFSGGMFWKRSSEDTYFPFDAGFWRPSGVKGSGAVSVGGLTGLYNLATGAEAIWPCRARSRAALQAVHRSPTSGIQGERHD